MNNIKRNVIFTLESRKDKGELIVENVPIRMRVTFAKQRIEFSTGYRIDVCKWEKTKQRVKNNCTNKLKQSASDINSNLDKYSNLIQAIFKEYEVRGLVPTPKQLKKNFEERISNVSINSSCEKLLDVFDDYIKECSSQNNWAENTRKKLVTIKNHLNEFDCQLTFDSITLDVLNDFVEYMQNNNLRNNTIKKQISRLKTFLRWGIEKRYTNNNIFESFNPKIKTTSKKVIFLSWEELTQLREYKIPESKNYLERVRDVFLFQCYSGLRYSDVYNLKRSDIKKNHIEITTIKTIDSLHIDFNKYSQEILDKYKEYHFENDKALPVISNQKMNNYLKELGELAGINESIRDIYYIGSERKEIITFKYNLMTTHTGRRTFVCNSLAMGIPAETVMKWTGHSDYKAMKPYVDIADNDKKEAMQLWNKKEVKQSNNLLDELKQMPKENLISLFTQLLS